jgi:hypothetical protein
VYVLTDQRKENGIKSECKKKQKMHNWYLNHPKETLKGDYSSQGGLSGLRPLRSGVSQENQKGGWTS